MLGAKCNRVRLHLPMRRPPEAMPSLLRALYSAALWLAQPWLRAKLARRAKVEPLYGQHMPERFGHYSATAEPGAVWVHAVSLGETRAAAILIANLRSLMPGMRLLLTHGTATGRSEGLALLQPGDMQVWQPWDTLGATHRFINHFKPAIGIVMETEVWPNLCAAAQNAGVPLVLANARLNAKSEKSAKRLAWLARPAYASFAQVWAQTQSDAQRLTAVGARQVSVRGNLKFDATPNVHQLQQGRAWRARTERPVVLLASAREGEEVLFLEQIGALGLSDSAQPAIHSVANRSLNAVARAPEPGSETVAYSGPVQWMIVPRHPQRFDAVAQLITEAGFTVSRRSQWQAGPQQADVWLGDTLGEMAVYYGLADVALLGGSFAPLGGQNLIESIAAGCPIVMGPNTFNFADAAHTALEQGAALRVSGMAQGLDVSVALARDAARFAAMVAAADGWLSNSRGAAQRMAQDVVDMLAHTSVQKS
jgi:3-deoxy-D-manno-octulosonic-acid transferase